MYAGKRLTLSDDRMLGGVCGGVAEFVGLDPTLVRIAYALLTGFSAFRGRRLCLILYWIIPSKKSL